MITTCPHCGKPITLTILPMEQHATLESSGNPPKHAEAICWRAPNAHPPHPWQEEATKQQLWCPGVKGTTMY